jgi:Domain of unknown function (DUF4499)
VNGAVVRPPWGWFALLDGGIAALVLLAWHDGVREAATHLSPVPLPSQSLARRLLVGTAAIHLVEGMVAARLARRAGLPSRGWGAQTFVVGFPSLLALRRRLGDGKD